MRDKFLSQIGDQTGPLTYAISGSGNSWDLARTSQPATGNESTTVKANGIISQYKANMILWRLKERNAATLAATQNKLDTEAREQSAILAALGSFTP